MHLQNFSGVVGGIAAAFVAQWLARQIKANVPAAADGVRTLRYHGSYAIIGWMGTLFFLACAVGVSLVSGLGYVRWLLVPEFGFFGLLSAVLIVMRHRCTLAYDAETIRCSPLWGQAFAFGWSDVEAVYFSGTAQWWRLHLRGGRKARVSTYMPGARELMQTLAARTNLPLPAARMPDGKTIAVGRTEVV